MLLVFGINCLKDVAGPFVRDLFAAHDVALENFDAGVVVAQFSQRDERGIVHLARLQGHGQGGFQGRDALFLWLILCHHGSSAASRDRLKATGLRLLLRMLLLTVMDFVVKSCGHCHVRPTDIGASGSRKETAMLSDQGGKHRSTLSKGKHPAQRRWGWLSSECSAVEFFDTFEMQMTCENGRRRRLQSCRVCSEHDSFV